MAGKKLGNNPFKGGVDSLIRDTHDTPDVQDTPNELNTQDVQIASKIQDTQYVHSTQGKKGQRLPRINMAFQPEILEYLQIMSGFENVSITQFVNELIRDNMNKKSELYQQILELKANHND